MNNVNDVLKTVMNDHGVSQSDIARLFGVSPQAIYNKFRRGSWDVDEIVKILDSVDCRLVIESGSIKRYVL
jgi:predicted transcriptional regulator